MIVQFMDSAAGTPVSINPDYGVTPRPDPADLRSVSILKLEDGETIRVLGEHGEMADKLARTP